MPSPSLPVSMAFRILPTSIEGYLVSDPDTSVIEYPLSILVTGKLPISLSMNFQEIEPIYHDEYTALDGDTDRSIGF